MLMGAAPLSFSDCWFLPSLVLHGVRSFNETMYTAPPGPCDAWEVLSSGVYQSDAGGWNARTARTACLPCRVPALLSSSHRHAVRRGQSFMASGALPVDPPPVFRSFRHASSAVACLPGGMPGSDHLRTTRSSACPGASRLRRGTGCKRCHQDLVHAVAIHIDDFEAPPPPRQNAPRAQESAPTTS